MLDVKKVRKNFPIYFPDRQFVYLDSASTTQKPQAVVNAVKDYYQSYSANIHRALYDIGERATNEYEQVREKVKSFLNVPKSHSVIFTRGTTESINLVAYAWGLKNLSQNDAILVSEMEHHSNLVPWQIISEYTDENRPKCNDGSDDFIEGNYNTAQRLLLQIEEWDQ